MAKKYVTLGNLSENLKEYTKAIIMPLLSKVGVRKPIVVTERPEASADTLYATYIVGDKEYITVEIAGETPTYEWREYGDADDETDVCDFTKWSESEKAGNGQDTK